MLADAGGVCPVEPFEHSGDVLGGDPFSGVGDDDSYLVAVTKTVKVYRPAGRCVPCLLIQQVPQHLRQSLFVGPKRR